MSDEPRKSELNPRAAGCASEPMDIAEAGNRKMEAQQAQQMKAPITQPATEIDDTGLLIELQGHLGRHLRHVYHELVEQPVPDKFAKLLEQLEQNEHRDDGTGLKK